MLNLMFGRVGPGHNSYNVSNVRFETLDFSQGEATSTKSGTIEEDHVRMANTDACWVAFGTNPTAVVDECMYLPENSVESVSLPTGWKVSVVGAA